ncbi:MAG: hypothetical protein Q4C82_00550 [Eubacteriales bacterium]|nr:hypothetical protein [Eubacteriales bacterium]
MSKWWMKGIAAALCIGLTAPAAAAVAPGTAIVAEANANTPESIQVTQTDIETQVATLKAYRISLRPNDSQGARIDALLRSVYTALGWDDSNATATVANCQYKTKQELQAYVDVVKENMKEIVNPPADSDKDDEDEDDDSTVTVTADHFLTVGGNWVTPVANAGQPVSIVLPVVNMGKTEVTNAVVTPVMSTDTSSWPFEITQSGYSQTIKDLPGTDTGMSDMDRRRELTWNLQTRSDVGNGYQKISFNVRYFASDGSSQTTTLDTYIQTSGTAGVSADGKASTPRVIVTGFETNPETVHAGDSFMLTLHLKNTSTATSVNNMLFEFDAVVEGKDADTTYESFLPTAGSNTIFVDRMEKNGTRDIQIEMEARSDLTQKPYAIDVNMSYEDEHVNAYTNKASVSIPVRQEARVDISEPEVMPASISVGSESNIMFSIYNLGKTKLYNVSVKTDSEFLSGGEAFVGNVDSGATGSVDMYVTGSAATTDDGTVKLEITYEDETGAATVVEKDITLFVSEPVPDDMMTDDMMMPDDMGDQSGGIGGYIALGIAIAAAAGVAAAVIIMKRRKRKEQMDLEDDILDLDAEDEDGGKDDAED